jgi:tRNA-specific 2-thiouridylase
MARILAGMSGGVDSSVAAALLTRAGHEVAGVTLRLWDGGEGPEAPWQRRSCCKVGIARHVCEVLGIPHRVVDLKDDFRREVVDDFLDTYLAGRTPNPCVRCNARVKFAGLIARAREEGFDAVATGHYARIERTGTGARRLLKGVDPAKDQSYFLYGLQAADLPVLRFPLGGLCKTQVMQTAREMGLPADEIAESQEICFVGDGDYRDFVAAERPGAAAPGDVVDTAGNRVGRHDGVAFHTIGQRRGLNLALGRRVYVVATDPATRRVVVGDPEDLWADALEAEHAHWLAPFAGGRVTAKIRYRSAPVPATAALDGDALTLRFDAPQRAVTPGQRVVLYRGDVVLGGAVITRGSRTRADGAADRCAQAVGALEASG